MLSLLLLRYLSDNDQRTVRKQLGPDSAMLNRLLFAMIAGFFAREAV